MPLHLGDSEGASSFDQREDPLPQFQPQYYHLDAGPRDSPLPLYDPHVLPPRPALTYAAVARLQYTTDNMSTMTYYQDQHGIMHNGLAPDEGSRQAHHNLVKHKRTRTGCKTCRERRVKCDEGRPICDRCKKGPRTCEYTDREPSIARKGSARLVTQNRRNISSPSSDEDPEHDPSRESKSSTGASTRTGGTMLSPVTTSSVTSKDSLAEPSPVVEKPSRARPRLAPRKSSLRLGNKTSDISKARWAALDTDTHFYLNYFRQNITHHHYCWKYDGSDFLQTTYIDIALGHEPLLLAIVAFAAYFHTIASQGRDVEAFMKYYDRSVKALLASFNRLPTQCTATLLTILQLATFGEYLGDWLNVASHHKGASDLLQTSMRPENIMSNETRRIIIIWFARFEIVVSFMAESELRLGREWYVVVTDYYARQRAAQPDHLGSILEDHNSRSRLIAIDTAALFGSMAAGRYTPAEFAKRAADLRRRIDAHSAEMDAAFDGRRTYVTDFPHAPADGGGSIVDATHGANILAGELRPWNIVEIDWCAIKLLFLLKMLQADPHGADPAELGPPAFRICEIFEGLQYAADVDTAHIFAAQGSLGIATTVLPREERVVQWCLRKLADVEVLGYIFPNPFRERMAHLWARPVQQWWLPDGRGLTPTLRAIHGMELSSDQVRGEFEERLRDIKGVFEKMGLEGEAVKLDEDEWDEFRLVASR